MQVNNNGELLISINGKTKLLSKEEIIKMYNQGTTLASKANSVTNTSHYIYPINRDSIYKEISKILKKEYDKFPNEPKKSWVKDDYPYFVTHTAESYPNSETSGDTVVDEIREKFLERSKVGQAKYGTNLDRKDLSTIEWLNHAIEEQMDSILYLTKLKRELNENNSRRKL
jgi:hypothetical protein